MKTRPPKIDERTFSDLMDTIRGIVPHYTPEWKNTNDQDPGVALLKIFTHITENIIHRFNQVPHKNFVAFLDMLGIQLLPAQPSRVPVTFYLAKGTDKEILIPARTQASSKKTDEHEELIFETEKNLLATPSPLKRVVSTDPEKDAIYLPPPGFLNGAQQEERSYTIVSSPSAGSKDFQLDHVTDLEEGDFLRIGNETNIEYGIVSSISGTIITIEDTLLYSQPASTLVEKITKFNLFEGKNMQEHSLCIGHKDLFNIKSTAYFILSITHREGTQSGINPLDVSWEYWGEVKGEEEEGWFKFNTIDLSRGFSRDGEIHLNKMQEGEIKEREVNGIKSRWIRCILDEPLSVHEVRTLPRLDTITFVVKSSGEKILPDLAFNNDTPLDISLPFNPFGKEPRMFDNFSIASKEAFSKKEGKIEIEADVEQRGILGPPTAISYEDTIKVFARGTYGRLIEVEIDPNGEAEWKDHGFPPDTKIAAESAPSAVHYPIYSGGLEISHVTGSSDAIGFVERNISVFMRAENGHLVEWFYNGSQGHWIDHETPEEGIDVCFDPFSIYGYDNGNNKVISVFVTGSNGHLYEFNQIYDVNVRIKGWKDCNKPINTDLDSSPYAVIYKRDSTDEIIKILIFVKGKNGHLYELDFESVKRNEEIWIDDGSPDDEYVDSRPFAGVLAINDVVPAINAVVPASNAVIIYVKGSKGNLLKYDDSIDYPWIEILNRPEDLIVDSNPHGIINIDNEGTNHIFIRSTENNLWEVEESDDDYGILKWEWKKHESPSNMKLHYSPWYEKESIFSASRLNSMLERVTNSHEIWNEYKDPLETALTPALSWEYWNSKGWVVLKGLKDETSNLLKSGKITFTLPGDIEETEIAGKELLDKRKNSRW
jgi:hypothetical protein